MPSEQDSLRSCPFCSPCGPNELQDLRKRMGSGEGEERFMGEHCKDFEQ